MLAGKASDDPNDRPSGVKITAEPSAGLLESIEAHAKESGVDIGKAMLAFAALGVVTRRAAGGFVNAILQSAPQEPHGERCLHEPVMDGNIEMRVPVKDESRDPRFVLRICVKCEQMYATPSILGPMPAWVRERIKAQADTSKAVAKQERCSQCDWVGNWDGAVCPECGAPQVKRSEDAQA